MAIARNNINELILLLRNNGDKVLNSSSKLSLSASLLCNLNESFSKCMKNNLSPNNCDMEFLLNVVQKTLALKILPDPSFWNNEKIIDINLFANLKYLEIRRLSLNLIKGIKNLRPQLEYITCMRNVRNLGEILENCGADNCQGFVWKKLKAIIFNYNSLDNVDNSLEFTPWLETLDLSHNHIQNVQLSNCLPNLTYLNVSFNKLENVPIIAGQLSTRLKVLILSNNFIEDINDLCTLVNLNELDLSYNCLLDHDILMPLTNLSALRWLSLIGNPLSFHDEHRTHTAYYLHFNITNVDFILDKVVLNRNEMKYIGSIRNFVASSRSHLNSVCSTESANTVINTNLCNLNRVASDITSSTLKSDSENEDVENWWIRKGHDGMQDSGIVAEKRPHSPAGLSIGSATSLNNDSQHKLVQYESDIEVISNPSQSSIEVIGRSSQNNVRFGRIFPTREVETMTDLSSTYIHKEQHRSL